MRTGFFYFIILDEVIDSVNVASKALSTGIAGNLKKKRSLTPDVLKASNRSSSVTESLEHAETLSVTAGSDATSQRSEPSPMNTPQTTKRTSISRNLRPKSHIRDQQSTNRSNHSSGEPIDKEANSDSKSFTPDLVLGSKFYSPGATSTPNPDTSNAFHLNGSGNDMEANYNSEDTVPELPASTALQHLGKARPKRVKKHAPSRGAVVPR